ncbi:MAG: LysR family transcriptional regulator [Megasphaera sp.]|jgi:DNA-binding transcriptional LysR family regulator|nr:LysR family transcriptional regulator [Megasphaera sp.]
MDIRQLMYFLTVAEEGQITAAARRLHMAQPPLSQQMKALETELGVTLFKREPRHVELTDAGELLVSRAQQILNLTDSTIREIKDWKQGRTGTLHIGTVSSSGSVLFSPAMTQFHEAYKGIHFEIYDGNTFKVIDLLHKGIIEIGIVRTPFKNEQFHCAYLPEEPMRVAMIDTLDWCPHRDHITLDELEHRPLILYRRFNQLIYDTCASYNFEPVVFCRNDDARTTILWANAGLGIAVVPASAYTLANHSHLHCKTIDEPGLCTRMAAIWLKNRYISSLAEAFLSYFKDYTVPH